MINSIVLFESLNNSSENDKAAKLIEKLKKHSNGTVIVEYTVSRKSIPFILVDNGYRLFGVDEIKQLVDEELSLSA